MRDIEPTLNDEQVMRFIHDGYLVLEGVVDPALDRACESLPGGHLTEFVRSEPFRREVLLQPLSRRRGAVSAGRQLPGAGKRPPPSL